jgi:hypothetical protein
MAAFSAAIAVCCVVPDAGAFPEPYSLEEGFDRPGADYQTFEQTGPVQDHQNCRAACYSQPQCQSYTYVKPGIEGPNARCRLKNAVPPPVENLCCITGVKGGKPKHAATPSLRLEWFGWDADKVGKEPKVHEPDGVPDHRFILTAHLGSPQDVLSVSLRTTDEQGIPINNLRWGSHGPDALYLGVESDGRRLNSAEGLPLGRFSETAVFDLYAHDVGQWQAGSHVLVEVRLGDGRTLGRWTRLAAPPDRLLARWQILCEPRSPDAFEPMTFSGRLQFRLLPDGNVTGYFGVMRLTGRLGDARTVSGRAEGGNESVQWRGTLERVVPGKPLRGKGSFRFDRTTSSCSEQGTWSSD